MTELADAPDASHKLRLVLDYLPCEACLAQPVKDQDLLCTVCHRLHRQVAVRVATKTSVILERPSLPPASAPIVIPPAAAPLEASPPAAPAPMAASAPPAPSVASPEPPSAPPPLPELEIVTEPLEPPAPAPTPLAAEAQEEPVEAEPRRRRFGIFRQEEPEPAPATEPDFGDDLAGFEPIEDGFEVSTGEAVIQDESFEVARTEPAYEPAPPPEPVVITEAEPETESDYVFREPQEEPSMPREEAFEEPVPVEEVPVERDFATEEEPAASPWAPPEEIFSEEGERPQEVFTREAESPEEPGALAEPPVDEVVEMEVLPDDDAASAPHAMEEEGLIETTIVEEPTTYTPTPPAASADPETDLRRLRGLGPQEERAFRAVGIDSIASLAGHDANEIATRTGVSLEAARSWLDVANLVQEVGVPIESAIVLVEAGVQGPRGLRESTEDEILNKVEARGGLRLSGRDIKRWKRRA